MNDDSLILIVLIVGALWLFWRGHGKKNPPPSARGN
jgi:hypothetical protein